MAVDQAVVSKLEELLKAIEKYPDPRRAAAEWKQALNQLRKTDLDANRVANVVAMRGVRELAQLIDQLRASDAPAAGAADQPDEAICRQALKAFRRRLKLTRLDAESQIDNRDPLSKGAKARISAIQPPGDWPAAVWDELVRMGELRRAGDGFYELTRE